MSKRKRASDPNAAPAILLDAPIELTPSATSEPGLPCITVMIAVCGFLLDKELRRQKAAGIVEQLGQLVISGQLLKLNEMYVLPFDDDVKQAVKQGWVIVMGE
jgi:hypothetical protein